MSLKRDYKNSCQMSNADHRLFKHRYKIDFKRALIQQKGIVNMAVNILKVFWNSCENGRDITTLYRYKRISDGREYMPFRDKEA